MWTDLNYLPPIKCAKQVCLFVFGSRSCAYYQDRQCSEYQELGPIKRLSRAQNSCSMIFSDAAPDRIFHNVSSQVLNSSVWKTKNSYSKEFLDPCLYDATFRSGRILKIKVDSNDPPPGKYENQNGFCDAQFILTMGWCMVVFESLINGFWWQ